MADNHTFETALTRLDQITAILDRGDAALEESLSLYQEGAGLIALCTKQLEEAKLTIEKLFPTETAEVDDE